MLISLKKGEQISVNELVPKFKKALIGLRWDVNSEPNSAEFDLDLSIFLLGENKKIISEKHLIFYNNLVSPDADKSIELTKDNLTGRGEGDDEIIKIDFNCIPENIAGMALCVTIHEAEIRKQDFGLIKNAYVRLVNIENKKEVLHYNLGEDFSLETAIIVGEFYKEEEEWFFIANGLPFQGGLKSLIKYYK